MDKIFLHPGREKSLLRRHPWIFSGALHRCPGDLPAGSTIELVDSNGKFLAFGAYSPQSQLRVRVWSFDQEETIDREFFRHRLASAFCFRQSLGLMEASGACRLIYSESDALPGFIVDRYASCAVMQVLSVGAERYKSDLAELLSELPGLTSVYERSDVAVRLREGLPEQSGLLAGSEPPEFVEIVENGMRLLVDVRNGQKTGYYLDQSEARRDLASLASGKLVLNAFSYTGAFGIAAILAGARHVCNVDSSQPALQLAVRNFALNGIAPELYENLSADVFSLLRKFRSEHRRFT